MTKDESQEVRFSQIDKVVVGVVATCITALLVFLASTTYTTSMQVRELAKDVSYIRQEAEDASRDRREMRESIDAVEDRLLRMEIRGGESSSTPSGAAGGSDDAGTTGAHHRDLGVSHQRLGTWALGVVSAGGFGNA